MTAAQLKSRPTQASPKYQRQTHPLPAEQNRSVELLKRLIASDSPELDEAEDYLLSALSYLVEAADFEEFMAAYPRKSAS